MSPEPLPTTVTPPPASEADRCRNQQGFGLMAALFVIVILAGFALLVSRTIRTSSVTSAEDQLWAQALYAAESAAQLTILFHDQGGGAGYPGPPTVKGFATSLSPAFAALPGPGNPVTIRVQASRASGVDAISREIEVKYQL